MNHQDVFRAQNWKVDSHLILLTKVTSRKHSSYSRYFSLVHITLLRFITFKLSSSHELQTLPKIEVFLLLFILFFAWYTLQKRAVLDQPHSDSCYVNSIIKHPLHFCFFTSDIFVDDAEWHLDLKDHSRVSARKQVENIHMQPPTCSLMSVMCLFKMEPAVNVLFLSDQRCAHRREINCVLDDVLLLMDHHCIQNLTRKSHPWSLLIPRDVSFPCVSVWVHVWGGAYMPQPSNHSEF